MTYARLRFVRHSFVSSHHHRLRGHPLLGQQCSKHLHTHVYVCIFCRLEIAVKQMFIFRLLLFRFQQTSAVSYVWTIWRLIIIRSGYALPVLLLLRLYANILAYRVFLSSACSEFYEYPKRMCL